MEAIPLYFIAGFLGAGKTTVLNSLLASLEGRRAGLIINEFGAIGVDASRLQDRSDQIFELNNGQIFCACMAAPLASSLTQLIEKEPELIIAECSGLSKPATLKQTVDGVAKVTGGRVRFAGLVTVIDGPLFPVLSQSVLAVREQAAYAGMILLNKTDLMDPDEVSRVEARLLELHPRVPLIRTARGEIEFETIEDALREGEAVLDPDPDFMGWGPAGRPKSYLLYPEEPVNENRLQVFLEGAAAYAFRIKGSLASTGNGYFQVDCVQRSVNLALRTGTSSVAGIIIIVPGDGKGVDYFRTLWAETVGTAVLVKE